MASSRLYDIPADLIGTINARGERLPERLYPIFRDEVSLADEADLSSAIVEALDLMRIRLPRIELTREEKVRFFVESE